MTKKMPKYSPKSAKKVVGHKPIIEYSGNQSIIV